MTIKRVLAGLIAALTLCATSPAQYATLSGSLQSSNGMPASNFILSFTPSQMGYISGTGIMVNSATYCATSTDGSVVGVPNPLQAPSVTVGFSGTLPPANYFVRIGFYDASGSLTLVSPETVIQLNSTGQLIVASPSSGMPAGAVGMKVYISTSTNAETLQGQTTGSAAFIQSVPLTSGAAIPSSNTTICKQVANDAIWPSGTGYTVALTDPSGNTQPGYPMMWQLMGPNTTINLSNGLPYYHDTVYFPTPILASPLNHAGQSIAGPLGLSGYNLINVGAIGVGTSMPIWPVDVENGPINASSGYRVNGSGGSAGQCLGSDGTNYDVPINCLTSIGSIYYQTMQANGSSLPQRSLLNFAPRFTVNDTNPSTTVDLTATGTAGTYASPTSITTDAWGRVTSVTAGGSTTPVNRTCNSNGCYRIDSDGTITEWGVSAAVPTGADANTVTVTFPFAFSTTTNLSYVAWADSCATTPCNTSNKNPLTISGDGSGVSTTGVVNFVTGVVPTGGGGVALGSSIHIHWQAIGQ